MATPDVWQLLSNELAQIHGPVPDAIELQALRHAVAQCADDAHRRGLSAEAMIKELRQAFAASSLSVTRETYLHSGASEDDRLVAMLVSWSITRYFGAFAPRETRVDRSAGASRLARLERRLELRRRV